MATRHNYGTATAKQLRFIGELAARIAGSNDPAAIAKVLIGRGAPQNEHTGALAIHTLSKFSASLLIGALLKDAPAKKAAEYSPPDPGELAQDRWNETQGAPL